MTDGDERHKGISRRTLLWTGTGIGLGLAGASLLTLAGDFKPKAATTPENAPAQKGDLLVGAQGANKGMVITVDGVPAGGPQVLAWPMDPETKVIRSGRSLNLALLVRAQEEAWYTPAERPHTVARIAAYSATCTHLCCNVSDWVTQPLGPDLHGTLFCPCHKSHFDPWDGAKVLAGPAPRPLPILPIETNAMQQIVVAGDFLTPPGCMS